MRAELRLWYDEEVLDARRAPVGRRGVRGDLRHATGSRRAPAVTRRPGAAPSRRARAPAERADRPSAMARGRARLRRDRLQDGTAEGQEDSRVRRRQRAATAALPPWRRAPSRAATPEDGTAEYFYVSRRGRVCPSRDDRGAARGVGRRVRAGARGLRGRDVRGSLPGPARTSGPAGTATSRASARTRSSTPIA